MSLAVCPSLPQSAEPPVLKGSSTHRRLRLADDASICLSVMGMVMGNGMGRTMTRMLGRLSALRVQSVRKPGYYGDGGGLYLRAAPGGSKGWIFRYGGGGQRRGIGVGGGSPPRPAPARAPARRRRRALAPRPFPPPP